MQQVDELLGSAAKDKRVLGFDKDAAWAQLAWTVHVDRNQAAETRSHCWFMVNSTSGH
jgi:hypothetical protein